MSDQADRNAAATARLSAPGATFGPFRYPAFRAIWTANLFSAIGASLQSVGAAWLMTDLSHSHRMVALIQSSVTLPIMLFGVLAGAIADNFDRRRVMLAAQIGMLLVSSVLALLTYEEVVGPYLLISMTLMLGIGTALNSPAWQASVRAQVGPEDLPQAISLNTIAFNLARSIGPALGGLLISLFSVAAAFALNALSFIMLIVVLLRWRPDAPPPTRRPILPSIAQGLRFCFTSHPLRRILMRGYCVGLGIPGYQALIPVIVREMLHGSEIDYGMTLTCFGVGSVLAAFLLGPARRRWGTEVVLNVGTFCFIVPQVAIPLLSAPIQIMPFAFLAGCGWSTCLTTLNVAMQFRSPEQILGRCLSIYSAVTFGGLAVGSWLWGYVSDLTSLPTALWLCAGWLVANVLVLPWIVPMPGRDEGRVALS